MTQPRTPFTLLVTSLIILLALTGCGSAATPAPTETPAVPTLAAPTETPTPQAPRAVLVAADGGDTVAAQELLNELATASGLAFETRPSVQAAEITSDWKVVVFLSDPGNLPELTAAAPQTQFVVADSGALQAGGNLSVIRANPQHTAFIGGYIAAIIASDNRAGALLPTDPADLQTAFDNGAGYYCGICSQLYPPYVSFPVYTTLASGSDPASWQGAFDGLNLNVVKALYIAPEAQSQDLINYISSLGISLVGAQVPAEMPATWAATILPDPISPLRDLFPQLAAGQGGQTVNAGLRVVVANDTLLTEGRLRLVQETLDLLQRGLIAAVQ